jgi:hypothetical protein
MFHIIVCRDGISHILIGINMIPINVLVQLIDVFIILVDGSRTTSDVQKHSYCVMLLIRGTDVGKLIWLISFHSPLPLL